MPSASIPTRTAWRPAHVLTSMIKRTDVAVETVVKDYAAGKFPGGKTVTLGLKENGVGLSEMKYTKDLIPAAILEKVETSSSRTSCPARSRSGTSSIRAIPTT